MELAYNGKRIKERSLTDLKNLVSKGEGLYLEFKYKAKYPEKIIREMVAFANTSGGQLLVGVDDDGTLSGLKFADEEEYVLVREIERAITPALNYSIERLRLPNENEILIFHIPESDNKPFKAAQKVYVRHKDRTIQASKEVREILKGRKKDKSLRFNYGDKERQLMTYLADNAHITIDTFAKICDIPKKQASRTLVLMVLTNVLRYEARDEGDIFLPV
ncbi:AlbA family DNA-binding domain-containing protein [Arcticibacterium luteifluviistationis]|uniref:Transcriptional regulator n=1 Tax=Arcticibacterium luteifluviistationis TaxID=1784714 RepID=A0A2Z4GE43_9BACT|nr:ATP-binding protein [Arcticibacterium luteifluviistationis]AWV99454.1 transcriptional regulator [Arcticibacterium luteifluviistationis]